jgi:hypothetical protein
MNDSRLICVRWGRPVEQEADNYETFERMHWVCFQSLNTKGTQMSSAEPVGAPQPPSIHVRKSDRKSPPPRRS